MPVGSTMQLSWLILPHSGNTNSNETLSSITLFAPDEYHRDIIYDGKTLVTLPIENIEWYIKSISDLSFIWMNPLFNSLWDILVMITKHSGKTLSNTNGDYTNDESVRFLQYMCLICTDSLPEISHDISALQKHLLSKNWETGKSMTEHFYTMIQWVHSKSGYPIWNTQNNTINIWAFEEKIIEVSWKIGNL